MIESLPSKKDFAHLSSEEIQQKVSEKKKELEHEFYDAITKNELGERKILDEIKENENEEEKSQLVQNLEELKVTNQSSLENIKM